MKNNRRVRRGVSAGTIIMLTLTALVLIGFFALMPSLTGSQDIRMDASKLVVAMDTSISQLASSTSDYLQNRPQVTALPPESLAIFAAPSATVPLHPQATPTPVPSATPQPRQSFTLCATGSIVWNSTVRKSLTFSDEMRFELLTDQLKDAFSADLSILSLENTLADDEKLSNLNMPSQMLNPIRQMGVNAVNIGHPDTLTLGMDGLKATVQSIQSAGMIPFGAHTSQQQRSAISLLDCSGVSVAILSYQDELSSASRKQTTEAEQAFAVAPLELSAMQADIAAARRAGAQVVVLSLNWGRKGANEPTDEQQEMAQALADAGADIILGMGSGVLQPVRVLSANRDDGKYHPVLCAYSLGHVFSPDRESRTTLTSIRLEARVVYDPVSGSIAFEDLCYSPTYAWRGKDEGRTMYRILLNDNQTYPDFISKDQKTVMQRSYKLVTDVMADTGIPEK